MPQHEIKTCSRCAGTFECKAGDIAHCQCNNIVLSEEEMAFIEARYDDCLCINCLRELKKESDNSKASGL
ncbi:MAG: cysteine-rich CWC family protein [Parafilimonas sp.]